MVRNIHLLQGGLLLLGYLAGSSGLTADEAILRSGARVKGRALLETSKLVVFLTSHGIQTLSRDEVEKLNKIEASRELGGENSLNPASSQPQNQPASGLDQKTVSTIGLEIKGTICGKALGDDELEFARNRLEYVIAQVGKERFKLADAKEAPDFKMVIEARSGHEKDITFYGEKIGAKYRCRLKFQLDRLADKKSEVVEKRPVSEDVDALRQDLNNVEMSRQAFKMAIEKLAGQLGGLSIFSGARSLSGAGAEKSRIEESSAGSEKK